MTLLNPLRHGHDRRGVIKAIYNGVNLLLELPRRIFAELGGEKIEKETAAFP
jgi:hypothetical protein